MHKKLIMACMAVAAFAAFVMAPAASAAESPTLTSGGVSVPVGTSITAVNTGITKFTGFGVECDHVHLHGTVTKNSNHEIEGTIPVGGASFNGTSTNTDCTSPLGPIKVTVNSELCLKTNSTTADTMLVTGCGANVTFTLEITGTGPCKYQTASVSGTYTTNATPATVNITEQPASGAGEPNPFFCPASGKLDMDFDMYTTNGTGVTVS